MKKIVIVAVAFLLLATTAQAGDNYYRKYKKYKSKYEQVKKENKKLKNERNKLGNQLESVYLDYVQCQRAGENPYEEMITIKK